MALTHFWPKDSYYHGILAATELGLKMGRSFWVSVGKPTAAVVITAGLKLWWIWCIHDAFWHKTRQFRKISTTSPSTYPVPLNFHFFKPCIFTISIYGFFLSNLCYQFETRTWLRHNSSLPYMAPNPPSEIGLLVRYEQSMCSTNGIRNRKLMTPSWIECSRHFIMWWLCPRGLLFLARGGSSKKY